MTQRLLNSAVLLLVACSAGTTEDDAASSEAKTGSGGGPTEAGGNAATVGRDAEGGAHTLDDERIVPEGLIVTALAGGNGVLDVIALTLRMGSGGAEIYAAVRNNGDIPACSAAVSFELFDQSQQSLAAGIGGLLTQRFYRRIDDPGAIAACVGPGDVTMAAVTDLPSDIVIEDVRYVVYRCPYFALDVVAIEGLTLRQVTAVTRSGEAAYAGTLVNGLGVTVSNPSVTVFPVNRIGRPLGAAIGSGTVEVPPGGSWAFETDPVDTPGVDFVAFPAGGLVP